MAKNSPENLLELRIIDCKMPSVLSSQLVEEFQYRLNLRSLSLVKCSLSESAFESLAKIVVD